MDRFETAAGLNSWVSDTEKQDRLKNGAETPCQPLVPPTPGRAAQWHVGRNKSGFH